MWFHTRRVEVQHCIGVRMLNTFTCSGLFVVGGDVEFDGSVIFIKWGRCHYRMNKLYNGCYSYNKVTIDADI